MNLLFIEDSFDDRLIISEALNNTGISYKSKFISSGEEAAGFLSSNGIDDFVPDLIFVDLNLDTISGFEILKLIKTSARLKSVPVLILTTSSENMDIINAMEMSADGFITKPSNIEDFTRILKENIKYHTGKEK